MDWVKLAEQCEDALRLIPGITSNRLRRRQGVRRRIALWRCGGGEQLCACISDHARHATGEHVGQRGEVRHRRRLASVERILDGRAPTAGLKIDKARYVAGGDLEAERRSEEH